MFMFEQTTHQCERRSGVAAAAPAAGEGGSTARLAEREREPRISA